MESQNTPKKFKLWTQIVVIVMCLAIGLGLGVILFSGSAKGTSQTQASATPSATAPTLTSNSSLADVVQAVMPSVVSITTTQYSSRTNAEVATGYGSGFVYSSDGLIGTNNHVIEGAEKIYVTFSDSEQQYPATVVGADSYSDLAIIKVDKTGLTPVSFGASGDLRLGDSIFVVGSPYSEVLSNSVSSGIVSGLNRQMVLNSATQTFIQTDAAVNPGNSGGPMFNVAGQMIGVVSRKSSLTTTEDNTSVSAEGIGFAIPSDTAAPILAKLAKGESVPRAGIGITGASMSDVNIQSDQKTGVLVTGLGKSGPAEKAGLAVNDIITAIDGKEIDTIDEMITYLETKQIGDTVQVTFLRSGQQSTVAVTVSDKTSINYETNN